MQPIILSLLWTKSAHINNKTFPQELNFGNITPQDHVRSIILFLHLLKHNGTAVQLADSRHVDHTGQDDGHLDLHNKRQH